MLLTRSPWMLKTDANEVTKVAREMHETKRSEPVDHQPAFMAAAPVGTPAPGIRPRPNKTIAPPADVASHPADVMRIPTDRVLAQVNDRAILLKDLVPFQPEAEEQAMTSEEYTSRLNRAIEVELIFQAAATEAVDLTPEQKRRVDGVARKHEATMEGYLKQGLTWSSMPPAQVEFEQRLTTGLLLQQNLVAREAGVAPSSDTFVQALYEHERREVFSRLKAASHISIAGNL
jgi:hypothetical protein